MKLETPTEGSISPLFRSKHSNVDTKVEPDHMQCKVDKVLKAINPVEPNFA